MAIVVQIIHLYHVLHKNLKKSTLGMYAVSLIFKTLWVSSSGKRAHRSAQGADQQKPKMLYLEHSSGSMQIPSHFDV